MLQLDNFAPPYGTTKTVLLTRAERNEIGRHKLATYLRDSFGIGSTVTVKVHGNYFKMSKSGWGFSVRATGRNWFGNSLLSDGNGCWVDGDVFLGFLKNHLDSCAMLRALKLLNKNSRDAHSQDVQKQKAAARKFSPNFILVGLPQ